MIVIDRRGDNAQSFIRIRRHPTFEEVTALFNIRLDRTIGELAASPGQWYWQIAGFSLNEGPVVYRAEARDSNNNPLPGVDIVRHWPGAPTIHNHPHLYSSQGVVGTTEFGGDKYGAVEFTYSGSSVIRNGTGPDAFWVVSATQDGHYSDRVFNMGWWGEFNHFNPSPIFKLAQRGGTPAPDPEPPTEPPPPADFKRFIIWKHFGNEGWKPAVQADNLKAALDIYLAEKAASRFVLLVDVLAQ